MPTERGSLDPNLEPAGNRTGENASMDGELDSSLGRLQPYSMAHLFVTSAILGIIILATIVGNVFVIAAIVLERNLRNVANYLIASLAVADLLVAILVMPLAAVHEISAVWFLGPEVCDMWTSFDVLCCTSSILHLVAISLDRYWVVTRVEYLHNRSARKILLMIGLSWAVSAVISIPPLLGWKSPQGDLNVTGRCLISQDIGYTIFSTVGAFYLPLASMTIIYLKVFQAAKSRIRKQQFKRQEVRAKEPDSESLFDRSCGSKSASGYRSMGDTPLVKMVSTYASPGRYGARILHEHHNQANGISSDSLSTSFGGEDDDSIRALSDTASTRMDSYQGSSQDRSSAALAVYTPTGSPVLRFFRLEKDSAAMLRKTKCKAHRKPEVRLPKEKLEQKRERKAARTLVIVTGSFVACWLPFFIVATINPFRGAESPPYPSVLMSVIVWLGYCNSLLNPIIYTVFNPDFRMAFRKILFGKYNRNLYRTAMQHA